mgnify:CR=1 FL=1
MPDSAVQILRPDASKFRVGVIGLGNAGYTHMKAFSKHPQTILAAIAGKEIDRLPILAQEFNVATTAGDWQTLVEDPTIDIISIATPNSLHHPIALAALSAGKHVFCEKPLCLTLADARAAVAACERRQRVLGIGHERRFEPEVVALRALIASGELGEVLQIEANFSQDKFLALPKDNWRLSNTLAPVGPLTATGIHLVDLAIAILGPCETLWARLATLGSDFANGDTLGIMMGFPNGANAMISAVLATPFEGRFAVYGSKGWVEIRDRTHPEKPTGWDITTTLRGHTQARRFAEPAPSVRLNLEAFARAVRGVAPYPVTPREMLANVAALEAIMMSVRQRTLVTVPQP